MPVETPVAPLPSGPLPPAPVPAAVPPAAAPPATALASPPAPSPDAPKTDLGMTAAVSGIIADLQKLMTQQLALLRAEIRSDWEKSKRAMLPMVIGGLCLGGAALMLAMTAAHAL